MTSKDGIWQHQEFRLYLGSTAFSGIAFAMQQLLISWILIGILELPATQVGVIQATVGIPGLFVMLLGGARADDHDPRSLLIVVYSYAPLLPLFLIIIINLDQLTIWSVLLWGLGMSFCVSYSSPAQQAILNRIAKSDVQIAVSAATAIAFMVQMLGLGVAGTMDELGLIPVLSFQAVCVALGAFAIRRLNPQPPPYTNTESAVSSIGGG
ncbi:MAG: MFS transporter, partial [Gammaproteobacteria bacterium]|nr:MFS transporter [Gammaproteobacteria bacterium]